MKITQDKQKDDIKLIVIMKDDAQIQNKIQILIKSKRIIQKNINNPQDSIDKLEQSQLLNKLMNNPSYYYEYDVKTFDKDEQFEKGFSNDHDLMNSRLRSDSNSSDEQQWQMHQQRFIKKQSDKQEISHNNYKRSKKSSSELSSDEQRDRMILNPDRSMKMESRNIKSAIDTKNKSLSSPLNKAGINTMFKKPKLSISHIHNPSQAKPKHKAPKQKQKKISNGSLSTTHTKPKKSKPSLQHIKSTSKKQPNSKKQIKITSNDSNNEFLVLGQQLYNYEAMKKVPQKSHNNNQQNKKVTLSYYETANNRARNQLQLSRIYNEDRLNRKMHNTVSKIQKYIMGFVQSQYYETIRPDIYQETQTLSLESKLRLYNSLLSDPSLKTHLAQSKQEEEQDQITEIIKLSIEKLEKRSEQLEENYPEEKSLISKWKNSKLHQLKIAQQVLESMMADPKGNAMNSSKKTNSRTSFEEIEDEPDPEQKLLELLELEQNDPLLQLERQLEKVLNQQDCYPSLMKQTQNFRKTIQQLLKNEHFPSPIKQTQSQITQRNKMQDTKNYFTPNGVLWFFEQFFTFIIEQQGYIDLMVDRLNEGFGFDVETKRTIARIKDLEKWYSYFDENSQGMNHKPLLDKQIYLLFQQKVIKNDPQISPQTLQYMHHFNLAIISAFNQQLHRFRPFYPYGQPLPNIQKPGKYFEITPESIFYFIQKAKFHIYTNYITFFAGLILPEGHEESKETIKYNLSKEIKAINMEVVYDWEMYHCLKGVAKLAVFEQLYAEMENDLISEFQKEVNQIRLKRQRMDKQGKGSEMYM